MLTLYHSPMSRSTTIVAAIDEMHLTDKIDIRMTTIPRSDGSGQSDPANPHPDGKVPALDHNGVIVTERPAILMYLSDLFPDAPAVRPVGHPQRGAFLTWLAYYGGVMEPVLISAFAGINHPLMTAGFRGTDEMAARFVTTFSDGRDYVLPDGFSTADLLLASPFLWMPDMLPKDPKVQAWFERTAARPSTIKAAKQDAESVSNLA